jgi:hypothetical protein
MQTYSIGDITYQTDGEPNGCEGTAYVDNLVNDPNNLMVLHQPHPNGPWVHLHPIPAHYLREAIYQNNLMGLVARALYNHMHVIVHIESQRRVYRWLRLTRPAATEVHHVRPPNAQAIGGQGGATIGCVPGGTGSLQGWPLILEEGSTRFYIHAHGHELFHPDPQYTVTGRDALTAPRKVYDGQIIKVWVVAPNVPSPPTREALGTRVPTAVAQAAESEASSGGHHADVGEGKRISMIHDYNVLTIYLFSLTHERAGGENVYVSASMLVEAPQNLMRPHRRLPVVGHPLGDGVRGLPL